MAAPKGNTFAQKSDGKADTVVHIRCTLANKSAWVNAAKPGKLSAWIIDTLNKAVEAIEKEDQTNDL